MGGHGHLILTTDLETAAKPMFVPNGVPQDHCVDPTVSLRILPHHGSGAGDGSRTHGSSLIEKSACYLVFRRTASELRVKFGQLDITETVCGFRVELFLFVPCFQLMSHDKNQHDIVGRHPTIFGDVTELAPR